MSSTTISSGLLEYLFIGQLTRIRRILRSLASFCSPSPAQRLPNEILSYIFISATHDSYDRADTSSSPLLVSQVCSRWRRIALSTSGLWTSITLTNPHTIYQKQRTEAWLSRSKSQPLDLLLDLRDPSWNWDEESHPFDGQDMKCLLDLLIPHIVRWRRFELLSDTWLPIFDFLRRTRNVEAAPMLCVIALSRCNAYFAAKGQSFSPAELKLPIPLFGGATLSSLRVVSLVGVHVDWSASALKDLTELEFKYHASDVMPSLHEFTNILTACPDLMKLSILGWGPRPPLSKRQPGGQDEDVPDRQPEPPIQLLKLTQFSFGFVDLDYAIQLLSLFSFPSLESLSIEDISRILNPMEAQDATPLLEWLAPGNVSSCPSFSHTTACMTQPIPLSQITTLHLHGISVSQTLMARFLYHCSSLHWLQLSTMDGALSAIKPQSLCDEDTDARFTPCPDLAKLTTDLMDFDALADVVTSRIEAGHRSLKCIFVETVDDDDCTISDITRAVFTAAGVKLLASST